MRSQVEFHGLRARQNVLISRLLITRRLNFKGQALDVKVKSSYTNQIYHALSTCMLRYTLSLFYQLLTLCWPCCGYLEEGYGCDVMST